jgi:hypothetical protein
MKIESEELIESRNQRSTVGVPFFSELRDHTIMSAEARSPTVKRGTTQSFSGTAAVRRVRKCSPSVVPQIFTCSSDLRNLQNALSGELSSRERTFHTEFANIRWFQFSSA